jgi:hypothetical protein
MTETQVLGLTNNKLTGTIPEYFGSYRSIKTLLLGGNNLEGKIPDNFINMVSLQQVDLGRNNLIGELPKNLGKNLKNLIEFLAFNNKLTGKLPVEQFLDIKDNLVVLDFHSNNFNGEIPNYFYDLNDKNYLFKNISIIKLNKNKFTGYLNKNLLQSKIPLIYLAENNFFCPVDKWIEEDLKRDVGGKIICKNLLVENIVPNHGSYKGGYKVDIFGSDFPINFDKNNLLCGFEEEKLGIKKYSVANVVKN